MKTNKKDYSFILAKKLHLLLGYTFLYQFQSKVDIMAKMSLNHLQELDLIITEIALKQKTILSHYQSTKNLEKYRGMQLKINKILNIYDVANQKQSLDQLKSTLRILKGELKNFKLESQTTLYNQNNLKIEIDNYVKSYLPKM